MELFTALTEAQRTTQAQFDEAPNPDRPNPNDTHRATVGAAIRRRLSTGLHALAKAIEPTPPATAGTPSLKH